MKYEFELKGKRALLLGGAGFIGHNLALELAEQGVEVTIADGFKVNSVLNLITRETESPDTAIYRDFLSERIGLLESTNVKIRFANISDRFETSKILMDNYDAVYLLAAVSHASRSNSEPVIALENGLLPFNNVLSELSDRPTTRLVYLSSSTVYGNFTKSEVDENDPCNPFGIYAVLKHVGETILAEMGNYTELNYSIARPSALYGERCISRRVSQIFLENAMAGRKLIFNGDREEKLDFTYIKDLVQGLIRVGFHNAARGEIFNITYGNARPVLTLVNILKEYFPNLELEIKPRDQATPLRGTLSNKKAKSLIGFGPKWSLEEGYKRYIEWYVGRDSASPLKFTDIPQLNE